MLRVKKDFVGKVQMESGERVVMLDENTSQKDLAEFGGCFVEDVEQQPKKAETKALEATKTTEK